MNDVTVLKEEEMSEDRLRRGFRTFEKHQDLKDSSKKMKMDSQK